MSGRRTEGHALDHLTASTNYAAWTTVIPPFTGEYKYLFVCTQYKKGTGDEETVTCTTISRDTETESSLQAIYNASAAQTTANTAVTNAATAQSTADTAKNAKRIIKAENLYYMAQKTSKISPTAPSIDSSSAVSTVQLSCEGWSTVYPNTAAYDKEGVVSCDDGATAVVYTCQRLTVTQNGTQSYEFTEITQDHTAERLYAATKGKTVIEGGYIKTDLLDVNSIFAKQITVKNGGSIQSDNYSKGIKGWKINYNGDAEFYNGQYNGLIGAKVFHFNEIFSGTDTGYTDTSGTFHDFANGDMWLIES